MESILITGNGDLGARAAEMLARMDRPWRIILASRDEDRLVRAVNGIRYSASASGSPAVIEAQRLDLMDHAETCELLRRVRPSVILQAAILRPWWTGERLPEPNRRLFFEAGFGVWLTVALVLPLQLMRAVAVAAPRTPVVNAAFPDAVNAILARRGLQPTVGLGNVDLLQWKLRRAASLLLGVPEDRVDVLTVAHHHHFAAISRGIEVEDEPHVTVMVDGDTVPLGDRRRLLAIASRECRTPAGAGVNHLAAASGTRLVAALLGDRWVEAHAPGPEGLPGGYPVRVGLGEARVKLPPGVTVAEAVRINEHAQTLSGIQRVDEDGTVWFAERNAALVHQAVGFDCRRLRVEEAPERALELIRRIDERAEGRTEGTPR